MRYLLGRSWFEAELRVPGVNGFGETWRSGFNGTLRECRNWAETQHPGVAYRVVRVRVVREASGALTNDHLADHFHAQVLNELQRWLEDRMSAVGREQQ